jgi:hypothetical protein
MLTLERFTGLAKTSICAVNLMSPPASGSKSVWPIPQHDKWHALGYVIQPLGKNSTRASTSMQALKTFIFAKNMAHVGIKCGV